MNFSVLMPVLGSLAQVAVAGLWQGLAIALALAVTLKFTRRISAAQRFALWFAAFIAITALPLAPHVAPVAGRAGSASALGATHTWLQLDTRWTFVLAALWLIGSLARAIDLIAQSTRLGRIWRTAKPIDLPTQTQSVRAFDVCATRSIDRPSVIGFFAPRVLIPDWLLPRLTPDELKQIVLHESTHLRRWDDWTNLFQKLCMVLFPLNPALLWLDQQLAKERERACDEAVVRITQAPRAYAACLASLAERGLAYRKEALSLGAWRRRSELVDRVHRILRSNRLMHPAAARLLLGSLGCSLLVVTMELARCPELVAFVPTQQASSATALNNLAAQPGDALYATNPRGDALALGAHIIQARAVVPSASQRKPFASRAHTSRKAAVGELRAASSEPGAIRDASGAGTEQLAAKQSIAAPRNEAAQFIVFTTWEQTETGVPANQAVADYDTALDAATEANAQCDAIASRPNAARPDASPSAQTQAPILRHTTFTQLILRVAPAGAKSSQPTAIPFGNGWIVIQL